MTPMQQMLLGVGGKKKTYIDEIFANQLYRGNDTSNRDIVNGINLSGEGGFVWTKNRDSGSYGHNVFDTIRGVGQMLTTQTSNSSSAEGNTLTTFNSNGFRINSDNNINKNNEDYVSWTFRKAKGFFDMVTWTGDGTSNRSISHSLGCVPGFIMVKCSSAGSTDWMVYHSGIENAVKYLTLNSTAQPSENAAKFAAVPTSTTFSVGNSNDVNGDGNTYIAYLLSGGESTAANARSVGFNGSNAFLTIAQHSDFDFGTGAYTIEFWLKTSASDGQIFFNSDSPGWTGMRLGVNGGDIEFNEQVSDADHVVSGGSVKDGAWHHVAVCRGASGDTSKIYVDGTLKGIGQANRNFDNDNTVNIGSRENGNALFTGEISNLRVVKGTAVYTSSFRPPTEPLTNISGTVLLCCNDSSTTGSTVTPGTITSNGGNAYARAYSPFDDPSAFLFGENGDENVVKCGKYVGQSDPVNVFCGWEPQYVLIKGLDRACNWKIFDSMRGLSHYSSTDGVAKHLEPNTADQEDESNSSANILKFTSTGFSILDNVSGEISESNEKYIYLAIRRPDGYVGKPADAGTNVFAMDTGSGSTTIPAYDSGFPVDFALDRRPATSENWFTSARLMGPRWLKTNGNSQGTAGASYVWDSNAGYVAGSWADSDYQSWMWARGKSCDVVTYIGDGVTGRAVRHNLSKAPEMIWIKKRDTAEAWAVGHKGLDGGNEPWTHYLVLDTSAAEDDYPLFNDQAPSSTHFTLHSNSMVNNNNSQYVAILFSSVPGISAVGSYVGDGTSNGSKEINLGFSPRFVILKSASAVTDWWVLDTNRGLSTSGTADFLKLNEANVQSDSVATINTTSTGFKLMSDGNAINANNSKIIYYAHA